MELNHKIFKIDNKAIINKKIIEIIKDKPFYGHIIGQLNKVFIKDNPYLPTFAVGKNLDEFVVKLIINIDFMDKLKKDATSVTQYSNWIIGILEHEVLHIVFGHLSISEQFPDPDVRALAVDCSVNSWIEKDKLPKWVIYPSMFNLEAKRSVKYYYDNIPQTDKYKEMKKNKDEWEKFIQDLVNSHGNWKKIFDDPKTPDILRTMIKKAMEACNGKYGTMPGDLLAVIDGSMKRKKSEIPWQQILRQFAASCCESNLDYTDKRISNRYGTRPGIKKEDLIRLAVAYDTSGSISDLDLAAFQNEIHWIYKNGASIRVYECDTCIQREFEYRGKHLVDAKGRGGTDLEPVLKEVEGKFDGLIYFTDGDAPIITKKYRIPSLWVLNRDMDKSNYPYKYGKYIRIKV